MSLLNSLEKLSHELSTSDQLCARTEPKSNALSCILKDLYDSSVKVSRNKVGPFDELTVTGLDCETVWEEINTRNKPLTRLLNNKISKLKASIECATEEQALSSDESEQMDDELNQSDKASNDSASDNEDGGSLSDNDDEGSGLGNHDDEGSANEGSVAGEDDYAEDEDMDAWLDKAEQQEEQHYLRMQRKLKSDGHKGAAEEEESDEEGDDDMEFVQAQLYEEEDDEDEEEGAATCRYKDFFVGGVGSTSKAKTDPKKNKAASSKKAKKQTDSDDNLDLGESEDGDEAFDEEEDDDYEDGAFGRDSEDGDDDEHSGGNWEGEDDYEEGLDGEAGVEAPASSKPLTKFQHKSAALSSQIAELEAELVQKRSWELRGEVKAVDRPENSLLGISADIERSSKPAPVITHEFTSSLEDAIRRRIKDGRFDDVQPKAAAAPTQSEGGVPDLSQERSRQGLGEVYAEHFLAKSLNSQPEAVSKKLESAREEALSLYHKISVQLDGLSHFFYTPRPVVADAKIQSLGASGGGLSSLQMEDIVPVVQSAASQLAPEEVQEKRRGRDASLLAQEELTSDDKKRLRRARKAAAGRRDEEPEDEEADTKAGRKRKLAKEDRALDDELARDRRVTLSGGGKRNRDGRGSDDQQHGEDSASYTKSAAFFSKLQQSAHAEISGKISGKDGKNSKKSADSNIGNGRSYKL